MAEQQNHIETKSMLPVGTLLQGGKYRIERYLSSGGFGNTYVANIVEFDEKVAIKEFFMKGVTERDGQSATISVSNSDNTTLFNEQKEKFKKEARRLRKLKNEHIVVVHDLFEENGTAYYVMDLIRGESVADKMKRIGQPLGEQEVLSILNQVLDALSVVHKQGMYHLDIKPANIMLESSGNVQLIDFGASKQMHAGEGVSLFTSSAMTYTPGYAPLEQQEQGAKNIGPWTDIYALGATLYKMLTYQTPPTASELLTAREPLSYPATVSSKMRQLIEWMMKPRFDERPQSISEVKQFLGSVSKSVTNVAPTTIDSSVSIPVSSSTAPSANEETEVISPKPHPKIEPKDEETEHVNEETEKEQKPQNVSSSTSEQESKIFSKKIMITLIVAAFVIVGVVFVDTFFLNIGKTTNEMVENTQVHNLDYILMDLENNMVYVEGGTFTIGATSEQGSDALDFEKPAHQVTLASFYICRYEVTQELWQVVMGDNPSMIKGAKHPVECVSWEDCQQFITKLEQLTGKNFRLPTEAEWEYAARGGNSSNGYKYAGGNSIDDVAWYKDNSSTTTHDVGTKRANELGLYDMAGNVDEWCNDLYSSYSSGGQTNPRGVFSGSDRVNRGGNWRSSAKSCRVSDRYCSRPTFRSDYLGFRLASSI